jgi:hypothetical protein
MIGRIVPYSQVFISVTLSLDEAAALNDLIGNLKPHKDPGVQKAAADLRATLDENLERAAAYTARRNS